MVARVSFSWTYMPCLTNNDVFMGWFLSVEQENIANIGTSYQFLWRLCQRKQFLFVLGLVLVLPRWKPSRFCFFFGSDNQIDFVICPKPKHLFLGLLVVPSTIKPKTSLSWSLSRCKRWRNWNLSFSGLCSIGPITKCCLVLEFASFLVLLFDRFRLFLVSFSLRTMNSRNVFFLVLFLFAR